MHALALTHNQLRAVASLTAFASRDDITPVIGGVRIDAAGGRLIATATDRYRVAELSFPINPTGDALDTDTEQGSEFPSVILPAGLLARTIKQLPRRPILPNPTIALLHDDKTYRVTLRDRLAGFDTADSEIRGNYPPVARLFPGILEDVKPFDGPVRLKASFLAALDKLILPTDVGARGIEKCYDIRTQAGENPNKPAPVLFTRTDGDTQLRALIQPNLIAR